MHSANPVRLACRTTLTMLSGQDEQDLGVERVGSFATTTLIALKIPALVAGQ
jgi:hypothetical protein